MNDVQPAAASLAELKQIQGLLEKLSPLKIDGKADADSPLTYARERALVVAEQVRLGGGEPAALSGSAK